MKFYELKIKLTLKSKIHFQKSPQAISKMISTALINAGYNEHNKKIPKNYVFSNLGLAKDGFYEKDANLFFRSFKKDLAEKISNKLTFYEDNIFKVNGIDFKEVKQNHIKELLTLNPVFVVMKNGRFWTFNESGDISSYLQALNSNLIRKYENLFNKIDTKDFFVENIEFLNTKPFSFFYKEAKFFGYKLKIKPKDDENSQKLAFIALGSGLGHKNSSVGGGFCAYKFNENPHNF